KGALRSDTKTNGDLASRFRARNALNSSPSSGCVLVDPPLARRRCKLPVSNSTSDHCRPQTSPALRPCLKVSRIIVLSRWPQRLRLAVSMSFSTSRSVRCSRGRSSALGLIDGRHPPKREPKQPKSGYSTYEVENESWKVY